MTLAFVFHGEVDLPRCLIPTLTTYFLFQPPLQVKWAPSEDAADGAADEKSLPPLVANDDSSEDGSRDSKPRVTAGLPVHVDSQSAARLLSLPKPTFRTRVVAGGSPGPPRLCPTNGNNGELNLCLTSVCL